VLVRKNSSDLLRRFQLSNQLDHPDLPLGVKDKALILVGGHSRQPSRTEQDTTWSLYQVYCGKKASSRRSSLEILALSIRPAPYQIPTKMSRLSFKRGG
jgi:hypothetical protein